MFFELLITHEEKVTHLFLTFITCHADSLMFQLLVIIEIFIEFNKFNKFRKFKKKAEKNEWLLLDVFKYLINLF